MTISELRKRPTYTVLTIAQQKFLEAYLTTGGDILESVFTAYGSSGDKAKRRARILVKTPYIYDLMVAINVSTLSREEVLQEASVIVRTSKSDLAKARALDTIVKLCSYDDMDKLHREKRREKAEQIERARLALHRTTPPKDLPPGDNS